MLLIQKDIHNGFLLDEQPRIVAYLDSVQAKVASLRELQSQTQEELDALLPPVFWADAAAEYS